MTDNEIIKAFKECTYRSFDTCENCPYTNDQCFTLDENVVSVLERQQNEIARLKKLVNKIYGQTSTR